MKTKKTMVCGTRNLFFALAAIFALAFIGCGDPEDGAASGVEPTNVTVSFPTPTADDFDIGNLIQEVTNITKVTITPKEGKSSGEITIYYDGETALPTTTGNYTVTFDVAAVAGSWHAATGLNAGTLMITAMKYTIIGSGTSFTATKNGETIENGTGAIQVVINAIRTDADGEEIAIQFGNGESVLDIGTASAQFNNSGDETWGFIVLLGKITSTNTTAGQGTILVGSAVSVDSIADIANTGDATIDNSRAIWNTGTLIISGGTLSGFRVIQNDTNASNLKIVGGTVSVTPKANGTGVGVRNNGGTVTISGGILETTENVMGTPRTVLNDGGSPGTVNITGGTISAILGVAVQNDGNGNGTITISGGTVTSTGEGIAARNTAGGTLNISGTAHITSVCTIQATVANWGGGTLNISGGTVDNTSTGIAVRNYETGAINISGGTISATSGFAVSNDKAGAEIVLGGNPSITGRIRPFEAGQLSVTTSDAAPFAPTTDKVYMLDYAEYTLGMIAVTGGASFLSNFALYNNNIVALNASGANLTIYRIPDPVTVAAIPGVTAPAVGATPVTAITETAQYTGTVAWSPVIAAGGTFAANTPYTATITLTAKTGYTLTGVAANFFTVAGSSSRSNPAGSGVVTATFPATGNAQNPVASDYDIGNLNQTIGNVTAVTIAAKANRSPGTITVLYNGSGTLPQTAGTYTVTFNVAAATGWAAASGLSGGTLTIIDPLNVVVTTEADSGPGSLRQALIDVANYNGTITFQDNVKTIAVSGTQALTINKSVTIRGNSVTITKADQTSTQVPLLEITSGTVIISRVHFTGGNYGSGGGAIRNAGNDLTVESCIFSNNKATNGGAIYSTGDYLTVRGCTFYNNTIPTSAPSASGTAIYGKGISLQGNIFQGNTGGSTATRVVYVSVGVLGVSDYYNVVDRAFTTSGTTNGTFGFYEGEGDLRLSTALADTTTFVPAMEIRTRIPANRSDRVPAVDFNGATRTFPGAPGAVKQP